MKPSVKRNTCQCFLFFKLQTTRTRLQSIHCANIPLNSLQSGEVPIFPHHRIAIHSVVQNERTIDRQDVESLLTRFNNIYAWFWWTNRYFIRNVRFYPLVQIYCRVSINRSKLFPFFLMAFETRNSVADFHTICCR